MVLRSINTDVPCIEGCEQKVYSLSTKYEVTAVFTDVSTTDYLRTTFRSDPELRMNDIEI